MNNSAVNISAMHISAGLAADLLLLSATLDEPGRDLRQDFEHVTAALALAVDSYLGMTVTVVTDGYPVGFTALAPDADARVATSLHIPMAVLCDCEPDSSVVVYAATPGAFVDFATDLTYALHIDLATVTLDAHLTPPTALAAVTVVAQLNQAVGILIDRGFPPEHAHSEIARRAHDGLTSSHAIAVAIIQTAVDGPVR